jgi:large-conductance mechanosensitive channel
MTKEDINETCEYITGLISLDLTGPFVIIVASILIMILNIFIIHKLSYFSHMHKLEVGVVAILYYVLEVLNFIIAMLFIDVLLKTYNKANNKLRHKIAFVCTAMNPLFFCLVFY